jgi:alkylation response protein AidB-like acyl-CoA dehydrogenase
VIAPRPDTDQEVLRKYLPGFLDEIETLSLGELEDASSPGIAAFKRCGGPGLLVPERFGGRGLNVIEAMRLQRAIGRYAPSVAVATTMHQFSVATLAELCAVGDGMEWLVLEAIGRQNLLVASGFAEGDPAGQVLRPSVQVERSTGGYVISGVKKPCSLSRSMDMITVSMLIGSGGDEQIAVALISARDPGMTVKPFWTSPVLAATETGEVLLSRVKVPQTVVSAAGAPEDLDDIQIRGYLWFELLICAAYLGIAGALVWRAVQAGRGDDQRRVTAVAELEAGIAALEGIGHRFMAGESGPDLLALALLVRYGVEDHVIRATDLAMLMTGVLDFALAPDPALLLASARALSWHPPSRRRGEPVLSSYLAGNPLSAF